MDRYKIFRKSKKCVSGKFLKPQPIEAGDATRRRDNSEQNV